MPFTQARNRIWPTLWIFTLSQAGSGVAQRFLNEFDRVAGLLAVNPGLGTPTTHGRRVFPLRIFPYSVVYRVADDGLCVLVVRHQHRKPGFGASRH